MAGGVVIHGGKAADVVVQDGDAPSSLPIDVIADILSRLPVKNLLRWRSVCKAWCGLIDSHQFAFGLHLPRSRVSSPTRVLIEVSSNKFFHIAPGDETDELQELHIPFYVSERATLRSGGSRHGWRCFYQQHSDGKGISFHIANPATRRCATLPGIRGDCDPQVYLLEILWDPGNDVYKVLLILWRERRPSLTLILTLGVDCSWRPIYNPCSYWNSAQSAECPCINGALHCLYFDPEGRRLSSPKCFLIALDVEQERFREIKIPTVCCVPKQRLPRHGLVELVELNGTLALLRIDANRRTLESWLLTDYSNGIWTKSVEVVELEFLYRDLPGGRPPSFDYHSMRAVSIASDRKIVIVIGDISSDTRIKGHRWQTIFLSYDPLLFGGVKLLGAADIMRSAKDNICRGCYQRHGLSCVGFSTLRGAQVESLLSLDAITMRRPQKLVRPVSKFGGSEAAKCILEAWQEIEVSGAFEDAVWIGLRLQPPSELRVEHDKYVSRLLLRVQPSEEKIEENLQ